MKHEIVRTDISVIGGGLSGICAAVAAARLGRTVSLVHNRPVLGGNSSSEIRVWVSGASATGVNRYARETGIMGELYLENQYRNPEGNPYIWDLVLLEKVKAEPNVQLFLNTDVSDVDAVDEADGRKIVSVTGWMMGSERRIRYESRYFLDCTGDGLVGHLAGASYRIGREASAEFGENMAPEQADDITLGSTILFYTKDAGHPVKFIPPGFAKDIAQTSIPMKRVIRSGDSGCHYWWIEWGGEVDSTHDNEQIRDELWSAIYGIWDYIKNSGQFAADTLTLEWVGAIPGKREYRRFVGDYVLNQNDIVEQTVFPDTIGFGGWSIDLHPPQGMYAAEGGSKHYHANGIYHIPFRCLYSVNVGNLLFAGRNISASHIAFGTTRVMATCAVMGEAAGTGAALCAKRGVTPRTLYERHMSELQQQLLRQDASMIGCAYADPLNRAGEAEAAASSALRNIHVEASDELFALNADAAVLIPVDPELSVLEVLVDATDDCLLTAELWETGRGENYIPETRIVEASVQVARGAGRWVKLEWAWRPGVRKNAFVIFRSNPSLSLHLSHRPITGLLSFVRKAESGAADALEVKNFEQPVLQWSMKPVQRKLFCIRVSPDSEAYAPDKAVNGYTRPFAGPNMWLSDKMEAGKEEWLMLTWQAPVRISEVQILFNDDVNEYVNNLHFLRTPFDVFPELVRSYRLEAHISGDWRSIASVTDNRRRMHTVKLAASVEASRLRLVVESTNGCDYASVTDIRVY